MGPYGTLWTQIGSNTSPYGPMRVFVGAYGPLSSRLKMYSATRDDTNLYSALVFCRLPGSFRGCVGLWLVFVYLCWEYSWFILTVSISNHALVRRQPWVFSKHIFKGFPIGADWIWLNSVFVVSVVYVIFYVLYFCVSAAVALRSMCSLILYAFRFDIALPFPRSPLAIMCLAAILSLCDFWR